MDDFVEFESSGRVWRRNLLSADDVEALARHCDVGDKPGARLHLSDALSPLLGPGSAIAREVAKFGVDGAPVRLVAFNKSDESNWGVPWHQDRVIALARNLECAGYSNWTAKDGVWHCEPPLALLEQMIFVRIHIDASDESNGAMELALGSHKLGAVPASSAGTIASTLPPELCRAGPGDVLIAKALILHRSQTALHASNRRALRVDYARRADLEPRLEWSNAG
jgi:hypothetical protein